jgi:hypothetical protein
MDANCVGQLFLGEASQDASRPQLPSRNYVHHEFPFQNCRLEANYEFYG